MIVDEVLAVGDADFQQKCLGKCVTYQPAMVERCFSSVTTCRPLQTFATKSSGLQKGKIREIGPAADVINSYLASLKPSEYTNQFDSPEQAPGNELIKLKQVKVRHQVGSEDHLFLSVPPYKLTQSFGAICLVAS
jgi:lipopolysaccharide transport system ATP-binding protein